MGNLGKENDRMREYTLAEKFALVGLNGLSSKQNTVAKKIVLKGIVMAEFLEKVAEEGVSGKKEELSDRLLQEIKRIRNLNKAERREIESQMKARLTDVLTEVPDILGCDVNYDVMDASLKVYKCLESEYRRITECVRAEILEDGEVSVETVCLLYLFRETGCLYDFFSVKEQMHLQERLVKCMSEDAFAYTLLNTEFHGLETIYQGFLKKKFFQNPYMQGINLIFPFLERRQAIFIDMVVFGTDVADRRNAVIDYLRERGHSVESVEYGEEHLLKIDNVYYRIFPTARRFHVGVVQGVAIVPAYQ
jgi:hypothetical protein